MFKFRIFLIPSFEYWRNHDLLLKEMDRNIAKSADDGVFPILDWPELRELFKRHEDNAHKAKKVVRGQGSRAIMYCGAGAAIVPIATLLGSGSEITLMVIAACLTVFGSLAVVRHYFRHRFAQIWLGPRMYGERIRHFYFQFILTNFEIALNAIDNPAGLVDLEERRASDLAEAQQTLDEQSALRWLSIYEDQSHLRVWVLNPSTTNLAVLESKAIAAAKASPGRAKRLLKRLAAQRVSVQHLYSATAVSLRPNSTRSKALTISVISIAAMLIVPIATAIGAIELLGNVLGWLNGEFAKVAFSIAASAAAIGFTAKLLDQGLRFKEDLKRNREYEAHTKSIIEQLASEPDNIDKQIACLFDLERHAFWETRQFFIDHRNEHFFG